MKITIVCIQKHEENYINEWLDHHINLGVDHIFICDNNESSYENKISDFINDKFNDKISIINYNDVFPIQLKAYNDIYNKYKNEYDWFIFIDIDEFIFIPETNNDIKLFLSQKKFDNYQSISIGWLIYDDNDNVYYENKPLKERFTRYINPNKFTHCKSITRGKINSNIGISAHIAHNCNRCLYNGTEFNSNDINIPTDNYLNVCYIKHFMYKSIEEHCNKLIKGGANLGSSYSITRFNPYNFFIRNKKTDEKIAVIKKYENQIIKQQNETIIKHLEHLIYKTKNRLKINEYNNIKSIHDELKSIYDEITYIYENFILNNKLNINKYE